MTNATDNLITQNLIINGRGFMNRIRTVTPTNGQPYTAVTMALEEGRVSDRKDLNKTYFECRVVGEDAKALLAEHFTDENGQVNESDDAVVRAGVNLAGCEVSTFAYTKGDKVGKTGVSLRSRLLKIHFLTIDGELVYTSKEDDTDSGNDSGNENEASNAPAEASSTDTPSDDQAQTSDSTSQNVELSDAVKQHLLDQHLVELDKTDPLFNQKRLFLIANDYGWDKINVAWVKKQQPPVDTSALHEAKTAIAG